MKLLHAVFLSAALGAAPAAALGAQPFAGFSKPFSATQVTESGEKVHIAAQGTMARARGATRQGFVLSDLKAHKTYLVFDNWKEYVEIERTEDMSGDIEDRLDPCGLQKRLAKEVEGLSCRKAGTVTLNGRKADKYVTRVEGDEETVTTFFDRELGLVVKQEGGEDPFELKDIKVGAVSGPFSVPAGYRKLTHEQYAQRIMQEMRSKGRK